MTHETDGRLRLPTIWLWLSVITGASIPFAFALPLSFMKKRPLNLTVFDPLVWLAACWLIVCLILAGDRKALGGLLKRWAQAVWPGALLICVGVLSLVMCDKLDSKALRLGVKSAFQWVEYLLVAPLVFLPLLEDRKWRQRLLLAVFAGTFVSACLASLQAASVANPYFVGGTLGNRNTFGMFMAMSLPLCGVGLVEVLKKSGGTPARIFPFLGGLCILLAVAACTSGGVLLAVLCAVAVSWAVHVFRQGQGGKGGLSRVLDFMLPAVAVLALGLSGYVRPSQGRELLSSVQVYVPVMDDASGMTESRPTMRYIRWAANLNMIGANPWFGVGWGQYQRNIKQYYGDIPYPEGRTDRPEIYNTGANEPFTFSWLMVAGGECGVAGMMAVLALVAVLFARSVSGGNVSCGLLGFAVGLLMCLLWTHPLVRGTGALLGLALAFPMGGSFSVAGEGEADDLPI